MRPASILARCFVPLPVDSPYTLAQWAAHSLRYATAWSNWRVAYGAYRLQVDEAEGVERRHDLRRAGPGPPAGLPGGDGLREDGHLAAIRAAGLEGVDCREFPDIALD